MINYYNKIMIEELIINLLIFIVYLIIVLIIFMGSYVEEDTSVISVIPFHIKSSAFLLLQFVDYFGLQYNEDQSLALF